MRYELSRRLWNIIEELEKYQSECMSMDEVLDYYTIAEFIKDYIEKRQIRGEEE